MNSFASVAQKEERGKSLGWKSHSAIWKLVNCHSPGGTCRGCMSEWQRSRPGTLPWTRNFLYLKVPSGDGKGAVVDEVGKLLLNTHSWSKNLLKKKKRIKARVTDEKLNWGKFQQVYREKSFLAAGAVASTRIISWKLKSHWDKEQAIPKEHKLCGLGGLSQNTRKHSQLFLSFSGKSERQT